MRLLFVFLFASLSAAAQDSLLFPRFSVTASSSPALFETNARIDPEVTGQQGTLISLEHDLGLDDSRTLQRFSVKWRPFRRHELAATHFSAPRSATQPIVRTITFRNQIYSINTLVTTQFDLDYTSLTYTYWARRTERDGIGAAYHYFRLNVDVEQTTLRGAVDMTIRGPEAFVRLAF